MATLTLRLFGLHGLCFFQEEKTEISKYCAYETLQIIIIYIYNNCIVFLSSENKQNWKNGKV